MMRQVEHHEHRAQPPHGRHVELALLDLRDPLNVGQAFRLAASLGVTHLHLLGRTPTPPNAKLNRTARGAQEEVQWSQATWDAALDGFRQNQLRVVAIEYATASVDMREVRARIAGQACVLVVGNEAHGLSKDVLAAVDEVAHVPMYGAISSFNVASALGIALWEWVRLPPRRSPNQVEDLILAAPRHGDLAVVAHDEQAPVLPQEADDVTEVDEVGVVDPVECGTRETLLHLLQVARNRDLTRAVEMDIGVGTVGLAANNVVDVDQFPSLDRGEAQAHRPPL